MTEWLDTGAWICLLGGSFFGISGAIGLHRFPDFYTRMHATGVTDTLCASLILAGLMLQADSGLVLAKLFLTLFLLLLLGIVSLLRGRPDRLLHLYFLDVGQGNAVLLRTPAGRWVLIDANDVVIRYIRARTDHAGDAVGGRRAPVL